MTQPEIEIVTDEARFAALEVRAAAAAAAAPPRRALPRPIHPDRAASPLPASHPSKPMILTALVAASVLPGTVISAQEVDPSEGATVLSTATFGLQAEGAKVARV